MPLPSSHTIFFGGSSSLTVRVKVRSGATFDTSASFSPLATVPSSRVIVEFHFVNAGASVSTAHTTFGSAAMKIAML